MSDGGHYHLGLPAWAYPGWKDRYFSDSPSRLASYVGVFDTVEGNTTFYRVPDEKTVLRWRDAVAGRRFRFCFKLPREVTHEPRPDLGVLDRFLTAAGPMAPHRGPFLVQFPATMAPPDLETYEPVFERLREHGRFIVEVRHPAFFDDPGALESVLERWAAGRVILDSRPLFEGDRQHPELLSALHEKPDVPVIPTVYNGVALVRLILHPDLVSNRRYIDKWAEQTAAWLGDGVTVYMMIHCPENLHCPPLALDFHDTLRRLVPGLAALAPWPVPQQRDLL